MAGRLKVNPQGLPVAVIVGATSKWQADGSNTLLVRGPEFEASGFSAVDSPGTRYLPRFIGRPELLIDRSAIADAFFHLHQQDPSTWTHELQLTPSASVPS